MKANPSPMSVADYCQDLLRKKIVVNKDYQRSEGIWASRAKSFFIESILLQYPIPKIFLYTQLDLKTRETVKEIVDGQQRSEALRDFFNNRLKLSSNIDTEELRGKKYKNLDDDWQAQFLSYSLPIDEFYGVPESDVQEAFRRMNSSNVPLNDEEQRNARFQGPFKWFVLDFAQKFREFMSKIGLFSKRDFIRMADIKAYAELSLVVDSGFATIKGAQLDALYRKYNSQFEKESYIGERLQYGLEKFAERDEFRTGPLLRAHVFQSIVLALIEKKFDEGLTRQAKEIWNGGEEEIEAIAPELTLDLLTRALEDEESFPRLRSFVSACSEKTNVAETRAIRFLYFLHSIDK